MATHGYIGIDFGTSYSHFAYANLEGGRVEHIPLGGYTSLPTCVLWKDPAQEEKDIEAYGELAIREWFELSPSELQSRRLAAAFKPDILRVESARTDAWAFLRRAYLDMRKNGTPRTIGDHEGRPVVVGVPAEIEEAQKQITAQIAEKAGFGKVQCVSEPLGALAYHLGNHDIEDEEARAGVIVVDFGGGTLDIAFVDQEGVREPWGEPALGGRLFDDLFFQWLEDENPAMRNRSLSQNDLQFGWLVGCREMKEQFSRRWAETGHVSGFRYTVRATGDNLGRLKDASLQEFEQRAKAYQPSWIAKDYFKELGGTLSSLGEGGPVNLFDWIRQTLAGNGALARVGRKSSLVILTGGSGSWPFMNRLVSEVFGVEEKRIIRSANPHSTIGEGLALYNVLLHKHEASKGKLQAEKEERKSKLAGQVSDKLQTFASDVALTIAERLMAQIEPLYLNWHRNGGSLKSVENDVARVCESSTPIVRQIIEEKKLQLTADVERIARDYVTKWLQEYGIKHKGGGFVADIADTSSVGRTVLTHLFDDIGKEVGALVEVAVGAIITTIAGVISGGAGASSGIALIATGPIGIIVGAGLGILVSLGLIKIGFVKKVMEEKVKEWDFGSLPLKADLKALHLRLSENNIREKLRGAQKDIRLPLTQSIQNAMADYQKQLVDYIDRAVERVIGELSILEQVRSTDTK